MSPSQIPIYNLDTFLLEEFVRSRKGSMREELFPLLCRIDSGRWMRGGDDEVSGRVE